MRVVLYPYCSQQDKRVGKFRLSTDSAVKQFRYVAVNLLHCGHEAVLALPPRHQCVDDVDAPKLRSMYVWSTDNYVRRYQWDTSWLSDLLCDADVLVTTHETLAVPAKALFPKLKVAMELCDYGDDRLLSLARERADLLFAGTGEMCCRVWPFSYEDEVLGLRGSARRAFVLFNARASSTNYSHHQEFLDATRGLPVLMADPTSFLGMRERPWSREEYLQAMGESLVVVCLIDHGTCGHGLIEAAAAGCVPVCLRTESTVELLGEAWPYFCTLDSIRPTVERALQDGWPAKLKDAVYAELLKRSYSAAWGTMHKDLLELYDGQS